MPFIKGQSGNPKGRKPGTKNKASNDLKSWIMSLIDKHSGTLNADLKNMDSEQRWQVITRLLPFVAPKMQAIDNKIDLGELSEEQLDLIIYEITKNTSNEKQPDE